MTVLPNAAVKWLVSSGIPRFQLGGNATDYKTHGPLVSHYMGRLLGNNLWIYRLHANDNSFANA